MGFSNPGYPVGTNQFMVSTDPALTPFTTIASAAVAAAAIPGSSVYILPGTYTEDIAWPAELSVVGPTSGASQFYVNIVGNQTFTADGSLSFQNISFQASSGVCFTAGNASTGDSSVSFQNCEILNSGGSGILGSSALGSANIQCDSTKIIGTTNAVTAGSGVYKFSNCNMRTSAGSSVVFECADGAIIQGFQNEVVAESGTGNVALLVSSAFSQFRSNNSSYSANSLAFKFTDDGLIQSVGDFIISTGGSGDFAASTGTYGALLYGNTSLLSNTGIDPQIDQTAMTIIPSSAPGPAISWQSISASQALIPNTGHIVTGGTPALSLPASSALGDQIIIILDGGTSWTITQGLGQRVRVGNVVSTSGVSGSVNSESAGDSITMTCTTANTAWTATSVQGNLLII